ncbi:YndJ family protein [Radiobacillus deserti]|nr:YndJ family protein [Radiobacillus deserti]
MNMKTVSIGNLLLLLILIFFQSYAWYYLLLTVAQLVFVPLVLHILLETKGEKHPFLVFLFTIASVAVFTLQVTGDTMLDGFLVCLYILYTAVIAFIGIKRFLQRGFVHMEECLIELGMIHLLVGGAWYLAFQLNLNLGFSPIITWLTAIHFHYAGFLLLVFIGFLGRIQKVKSYSFIAFTACVAPWVVAIGISFSRFLEVVSVLVYMVAIYGGIYLACKTPYERKLQKALIPISFLALGVSIVFSLLYAVGNWTGLFHVSLSFMLLFHGGTNGLLFAAIGVLGWYLGAPSSKAKEWNFPISNIRGWRKKRELEKLSEPVQGLVEDMDIYRLQALDREVRRFYENTNRYQLLARVYWHPWFLPFAGLYKIISRFVQQINLPLTPREIEMTGQVVKVDDAEDGRESVRAWIRKVDNQTVFVALYSFHTTKATTYMNIALPLPFSTMIGILKLEEEKGKRLSLSSKDNGEAGIYLAIGKSRMKLPLQEHFTVSTKEKGNLEAIHRMTIFSIPFLTIQYTIKQKD